MRERQAVDCEEIDIDRQSSRIYVPDGPCGALTAVVADGVDHGERSRWGSGVDRLEARATAFGA